MSDQIIGMHHWFESPPGRYLLAWEQARIDEAVADMFGYHSLQVGMPLLDGLRANRMPHRWRALDAWPEPGSDESPAPDLLAHAAALPFPDNSLDLVLLPHALELSQDPHTALREVARVLVPEGRVVITGLNPVSLWGLRQQRQHFYRRLTGGRGRLFLPDVGDRLWPILGAAYFMVGIKRVHGMRLLEPSCRSARPRAAAAVPLVRRSGKHHKTGH